MDEEDVELPSWHPKIVSYDIDEERNAFGPPVLRKNEIAKFDNVLMFHGKFWFMEEAMFKSSIAMNNRTKRIIAIADSTEDARKMKETFRNAGVFIEDVIVFDDENDDDDDLSEKVIVPGFHDSHTHVMSLGMKMEFEIDLADVKTKQEFVLKLKIKERDWAPFHLISRLFVSTRKQKIRGNFERMLGSTDTCNDFDFIVALILEHLDIVP